jgi:hypothetical protein
MVHFDSLPTTRPSGQADRCNKGLQGHRTPGTGTPGVPFALYFATDPRTATTPGRSRHGDLLHDVRRVLARRGNPIPEKMVPLVTILSFLPMVLTYLAWRSQLKLAPPLSQARLVLFRCGLFLSILCSIFISCARGYTRFLCLRTATVATPTLETLHFP